MINAFVVCKMLNPRQSCSGSLYGKWSSIFLLYSAFASLMVFLRLDVESPAKVVVGRCMGSGPQSFFCTLLLHP